MSRRYLTNAEVKQLKAGDKIWNRGKIWEMEVVKVKNDTIITYIPETEHNYKGSQKTYAILGDDSRESPFYIKMEN